MVPFAELPFVINPKKGYFVTANNRVFPETAKYDLGASMTATARSKRIDEMMRDAIKSGKKMTATDMIAMQQDVMDIHARRTAPKIYDVV